MGSGGGDGALQAALLPPNRWCKAARIEPPRKRGRAAVVAAAVTVGGVTLDCCLAFLAASMCVTDAS